MCEFQQEKDQKSLTVYSIMYKTFIKYLFKLFVLKNLSKHSAVCDKSMSEAE